MELKALWTDPDFDASQHTFYYARALQIPTPRWSTYDAATLGITPPGGVAAAIQERAWGTPIWHTPTATEAAKAKPGLTVADLLKDGATPLGDDELKQLVFGKNLTVRNTVTDRTTNVLFGADGKRVITELNGELPKGGDLLEIMHSGISSSSASYEIKGGRIVTTIEGTPFDLTAYHANDKYIAARSNEFGHANYELVKVAK